MPRRRVSAANSAIVAGGIVTPVGLPGVTSRIARVREVISASAAAAVGTRSGPGSRCTTLIPLIRSHMSWLK